VQPGRKHDDDADDLMGLDEILAIREGQGVSKNLNTRPEWFTSGFT
jgi:hypothetical protein